MKNGDGKVVESGKFVRERIVYECQRNCVKSNTVVVLVRERGQWQKKGEKCKVVIESEKWLYII